MGTGLGILLRKLLGAEQRRAPRQSPSTRTGSEEGDASPGTTAEKAPELAGGLGARLQKFRCFDFELFVDPLDRTAAPIVNHGVYEHHIMPHYLAAIRPGMHVLDIGANIGVYSIAAARKGAHVVAVDASPENCKLITLNAAHNGVSIDVLPMAVSDRRGMALYPRVSESNKTIRNYGLPLDWFDKLEATYAAPVDSIIGEAPIDVVKIDIEGREYAALKPAEGLFRHRPTIFMEYSPLMCETGSGVPGQELLRLFTSRNYRMTFLSFRGTSHELGQDVEAADLVAQQELAAGFSIIDLVMTPAEKV